MTSPHSDAVAAIVADIESKSPFKEWMFRTVVFEQVVGASITAHTAWLAEHAATEFAAAVALFEEVVWGNTTVDRDFHPDKAKQADQQVIAARIALLAMGPGRSVVTDDFVDNVGGLLLAIEIARLQGAALPDGVLEIAKDLDQQVYEIQKASYPAVDDPGWKPIEAALGAGQEVKGE